jgi:hypothetical protein
VRTSSITRCGWPNPYGCNFSRAVNDHIIVNNTDVISVDEHRDGDPTTSEMRLPDDEIAYLLAVRRHPAGKRLRAALR